MAVLKKPLNYGGRLFKAGDSIQGHVPLDMIQLLQQVGALLTDEEREGQEQTSSDVGAVEHLKTVEELADHLKTVIDAAEVQALLEEEQAKEKPRAGAVKLLEARLKELEA